MREIYILCVMMKYDIPGHSKPLSLDMLILDLNGTLTIDGKVINGVKTRIQTLQKA
jgi:soluble P-type ATPase